jgi:hypothetical protein
LTSNAREVLMNTNTPGWLARLLSVGGVLEASVGLGLLVDPSFVATILLRSSLDGAGIVVGRIAGGGLLALGIACWSARRTPTASASRGASWGLFAYNVVACVTLAAAGGAVPGGGFVALSAAVLHGAMAAALSVALLAWDSASI